MSRWWSGASIVVLVLSLVLGACSDGDPDEAKPERPTTAEGIASSLGCTATEESPPVSGFDEALECRMGDRADNLLLLFDEKHRERVERQFETGPVNSGGVPPERGVCPDGTPVPYIWMVLGPDWVMRTVHDEVKDDLVDDFDGEVMRQEPWSPTTNGMNPCDQTTSTQP
jgi:hypothetical protein